MAEFEAVSSDTAESAVTQPFEQGGSEQPRGVGGWLLFFCVSLTIISPAVSLFLIATGLLQSIPYFSQDIGSMALVVADTGVSLALIAAYIYAGLSLWRVRPRAVQIARAVLIASAAYALLAPLEPLLLGLDASGRKQVLDSWLQMGWRGVMYSALWLNYLMRSKRVRATYLDWNPPIPDTAQPGPSAKWYHFVIAFAVLAAIVAVAVLLTR